jgi:hypothetical protein
VGVVGVVVVRVMVVGVVVALEPCTRNAQARLAHTRATHKQG